MAWTQADLDSIRAGIAAGVLETKFADGSSVRYQSTADMLAAEQRIAAVIARSVQPVGMPLRRYAAYGRGPCG